MCMFVCSLALGLCNNVITLHGLFILLYPWHVELIWAGTIYEFYTPVAFFAVLFVRVIRGIIAGWFCSLLKIINEVIEEVSFKQSEKNK